MWDDSGHYVRLGALVGHLEGRCRLALAASAAENNTLSPTPDAKVETGVRKTTEDEFSVDRILAIQSVELLDASGASKRVYPMGAEVNVIIHYEASRAVVDPVFAVTFHRLDGVQMDHKNSRLLGQNVGSVAGRGQARFSFSPLRLGPGEYLVTVAILKYLDPDNWIDQPPSYDRHDRRYSLSIFSTLPGAKNLGAVIQECTFCVGP
jgi:lipopolysaccharide transport system ATP-binding protein